MAYTLFKNGRFNFLIIILSSLLWIYIRQCHRKARTWHPPT